jgi:hypothetical protein
MEGLVREQTSADSEGTCLLGTGSTTTLSREYREESQLMNKHAHTDKYQAKQL